MLKTVSDPPHNPHSLEDGILQTMEYAQCNQAVAQQAIWLPESALVQVPIPAEARALH